MPVSFLTPQQRETYGRYASPPTAHELSRYYHLNDDDLTQIMSCRGEHNRLGFALQLTTVRYLGTFLEDPVAAPSSVVETLARQLGLAVNRDALQTYRSSKQRWEHVTKIREHYGYSDLTEPRGRLSADALALRPVLDRLRAAQQALRACDRLVVGAQDFVAGVQHARTVRGAPAQQGRDQTMAPVGTRHYGRTA